MQQDFVPGKLLLDMEGGLARVTFRDGGIIAARFGELDNHAEVWINSTSTHHVA